VRNLTIVILNWDSGQEPQEVEDLLENNDEELWVDGLDGSELIVVYITQDLFKILKVVHNLFFHSCFFLSTDTTHVVEDGHHVIEVGGINFML